MPGWAELSSFSALRALLCGTLTVISFWGVGRILCGRLLAGVHDSVRLPAECIAGVLATSLLVQGLAMADASRTRPLLAVWLAGLVAAGVAVAFIWRRRTPGAAQPQARPRSLAALCLWAGAGILAVALLLAAAAPETRSDELSYHIPATARLITDGGLRFYPLPWEASVLPQLVWHFALAPLYLVAGAAAGGVASAWLGLLLALSIARLVGWQTASPTLGAAGAFLTLAAGYSFIFFPTAGPHAFGCLSVHTAVASVVWSAELRRAARPPAYLLAVALACAGALAGKITMLPLIVLVCSLAAADVLAGANDPRVRRVSIAQLILIPALAIGPLALWAWIATGSPLGALTARVAHSAAFDRETLAAYEGTRELFASRFQWRFEAAYWNLPMLLCGFSSLALEPLRSRRVRWWLLFGCQAAVLLLLLPKEIRHLGGLQYSLIAGGLTALAARWHARGRFEHALALGSALAALPWALFVLWVATIYLPLASGRESASQFVERYAGLQADYEELDRRLPPDAKLLIGRSRSDPTQYGWYARPPVYYAPRRVLFDTAEALHADHVYLLYIGAGAEGTRGRIALDPWLPDGYALGRSVYANARARFYPSRTPGGNAGVATLEVFELTPAP